MWKILVSFLLLLSIACSSESDEPAAPVQDSSVLTNRSGNYQAFAPDSNLNTICIRYDMNLTGNHMVVHQRTFSSESCEGALLGEIWIVGKVQELGLSAEDPTIRSFNLIIESNFILPHARNWAMRYGTGENSGECEVETKPLEEEREVSGLDCGPIGNFPSVGTVFFSHYKLSGNQLLIAAHPHETLPSSSATALEIQYTKTD